MKKILTALLLLISITTFAGEKPGLLIIAHGAPMKFWNQPVLHLEDSVKAFLSKKQITGFDEVRVALMEFTEPTVATVVKEMEDKGITEIYVIPLFIAPSSHSVYDVPTILGTYYNKKEAEALKVEGTKLVKTNAKITVGPTLNYGDVIKEILLEQVKDLSKDPTNEGLVLLAHGDSDFLPCWNNLANETASYILGQTGIECYDKAFVEIGQSFGVDGVNAITKVAAKKDKVIVVGIYLSMGVKNMVEHSGIVMMGMKTSSKSMLKDINVVYSEKGLLPNPKVTEWIVDRAVEWLNK